MYDELTWVRARAACEQLLARFHHNADAGRATESLGLFTSDAVLELPMFSARGTEEIGRVLSCREALAARVTMHAAAYFEFTLSSPEDGSAGGGMAIYAGTPDGLGPVPEALTRYSADFRRLGQGWRIARLQVRIVSQKGALSG
jgi:hypothetical protein